MKKTLIYSFVLLCMSCMAITATAGAKEKTKQIGKFKYTYSTYSSNQIWIQNIEPVSGKGIGTLKIPSSIEGKKVVKLGWKYDSEEDDYITTNANIFGISVSEDDDKLRPEKMIRRVGKIKKIILPDSVKIITDMCFGMLGDGKCINIPSKVEKGVENFCYIKWEKLTVSPKNKKYRVKNGLLLSKNSKKAYGSTFTVPGRVTYLSDINFSGKKVKKIIIPASVKKISHAITISEKNIIYEFKSKKPPIFKNKHSFENTTLYVPKGSKKAYQNALKETNGVYVEVTLYEK